MTTQPTTPTYATNAQIDEAVLEYIRLYGPWNKYQVADMIRGRNGLNYALRQARLSCQRLKQRGLVKFDKGWRVA